jgi:hypothetical protein
MAKDTHGQLSTQRGAGMKFRKVAAVPGKVDPAAQAMTRLEELVAAS